MTKKYIVFSFYDENKVDEIMKSTKKRNMCSDYPFAFGNVSLLTSFPNSTLSFNLLHLGVS